MQISVGPELTLWRWKAFFFYNPVVLRVHVNLQESISVARLRRLASSVEELRAAVRSKEARLLGANSKVSLQVGLLECVRASECVCVCV